MNIMRQPEIEKVTLNIGTGKSQDRLEKGIKLLNTLTGLNPTKTITQKRIAGWGLRPGLPIGCKVTLRKKKAQEVLKRMIEANDFILKESNFDENGTISFGVKEYIDIPEMKYDPEIGSMGLQVCITLKRKGFRIKYRKIQKKKIPQRHRLTKQEAIDFMEKEYNTKMENKE